MNAVGITQDEAMLVVVITALVLLAPKVPRWGMALGRWFDR